MNKKTIYLAGGCFWGVEAYMDSIDGVLDAVSGYANGSTENPSYEDVVHRETGHAEAVCVTYDRDVISLEHILTYYFRIIDPTSLNKQGNDAGTQYRTGIYYDDLEDEAIILKEIELLQRIFSKKVRIEVEPLENFYLAEEYHQNYLKKNPNGYCHIDLFSAAFMIIDEKKYSSLSAEELKLKLTEKQYRVTQEGYTEMAFQNEYWNYFEEGIYVDITTGEPLFSSKDKFDSECGWPSFSKPIVPEVVNYVIDSTHGMERVEVVSRVGNAHLGHVFEDGPKKTGGLRYCINSASLEFIPLSKMVEKGYEDLI